ncbi:MAG: hypothetical protein QOG67_32 [Verrucomicrobiota bacterium]|jgi:hypothetical protein
MIKTQFLIVAVVLGICTYSGAEQLYVREVDEAMGTGWLHMRLEEIEHAPSYSVIEVTHTSGAPTASSAFVVRGMWEIARQRGTPFFIKLKEWEGPDGKWMYKVGFTYSDHVDLPSYFGESPKEARFLSVQQLAKIFRR